VSAKQNNNLYWSGTYLLPRAFLHQTKKKPFIADSVQIETKKQVTTQGVLVFLATTSGTVLIIFLRILGKSYYHRSRQALARENLWSVYYFLLFCC